MPHPGLAKLISQQLMLPGFAYAHDVEATYWRPLVAPNPVLHKTTRSLSVHDMREHLPREINFARFRCACNAAGQPVGEWQRVIVGPTSTTVVTTRRIGVVTPESRPPVQTRPHSPSHRGLFAFEGTPTMHDLRDYNTLTAQQLTVAIGQLNHNTAPKIMTHLALRARQSPRLVMAVVEPRPSNCCAGSRKPTRRGVSRSSSP